MISFFIKYRNPILITTVAIFLISIGVLGAGIVADQYSSNAVLAKVGNAKVKYKDFINTYNLIRQKYVEEGKEITEEQDKQLKQEILQEMILQEALVQEANSLAIGSSKMEVAYFIKNSPMFAPNGEFNKNAYIYVVRNQFHVNPAEFESNLNKQITTQKLKRVLAFASLPTSFERDFLVKNIPAKLKEEEKESLNNYILQIKGNSFGIAFTEALNAKYKSSIDMEI